MPGLLPRPLPSHILYNPDLSSWFCGNLRRLSTGTVLQLKNISGQTWLLWLVSCFRLRTSGRRRLCSPWPGT